MSKRANYGFEKRQKEIKRQKKQEEKAAKRQLKREEAAANGEPTTPVENTGSASDPDQPAGSRHKPD